MLPPITQVHTIDDVIAAIQGVIDWSIASRSRLGYFAALYKRITVAIKTAVAEGLFDDGPRMERFDVVFASRYFAALNGYFHAGDYPQPSHCWRVAFDAAAHAEPIIVQHMLAGVNAHIDLDLGIAASEVAPGAHLESLRGDFYKVNAVLASQARGVVEEIDQLSPVLADLYKVLMEHEIDLIDQGLIIFRDSAWKFATVLAAEPAIMHSATVMLRDLEVAKLGTLILYPPPMLAGIAAIIGAKESRDVVRNIQVLDGIASIPAPISLTMSPFPRSAR